MCDKNTHRTQCMSERVAATELTHQHEATFLTVRSVKWQPFTNALYGGKYFLYKSRKRLLSFYLPTSGAEMADSGSVLHLWSCLNAELPSATAVPGSG